MPRNPTVSVTLDAKDKASKKVKKVQSGFEKFGAFIKSAGFLAGFAAAAAAVRALAKQLQEAARMFGVQQAAVQKLRGALAPLGPQADIVTKSLAAQASALQKVSTFGDEQIIGAQSLLASFTRNESALKELTKSTLDFAAATGSDLNAAASLVGRSFASSTNALTRYGIEVEGAAGSTERLNSLVENSAKLFGGQARAAIESYAGAVAQLDNASGDVQESIGGLVVGSPELVSAMNRNADATAAVAEELDKARGAATGFAESYNDVAATIKINLANWLYATRVTLGLTDAAGKAADSLQAEADAAAEVAKETSELTVFTKALVQVIDELFAAEERRRKGLEIGGVRTNTQLLQALAEQREAQAGLNALYAAGELDAVRYEASTARIREEMEALEAVLNGNAATVDEYKDSLVAASEATEQFGGAAERGAVSAERFARSVAVGNQKLQAAERLSRITAQAFDDLARSQGRAAAVAAAAGPGGENLTMGGRRVKIFGGGRLTSPKGFQSGSVYGRNSSSLSGGTFTVGP